MRATLKRFVGPLAFRAILALAASGCGSQPGATPPEASQNANSGSPGQQSSPDDSSAGLPAVQLQQVKNYVGKIEGTNALIALVEDQGKMIAYVSSEDQNLRGWFDGQTDGQELLLADAQPTQQRSLLGAVNGSTASGTLQLPNGAEFRWIAERVADNSPAGLYVYQDVNAVTTVIVTEGEEAQGESQDSETGSTRRIELAEAIRQSRFQRVEIIAERPNQLPVVETVEVVKIVDPIVGIPVELPPIKIERGKYLREEVLEVKFAEGLMIRLREGSLKDLKGDASASLGLEEVLSLGSEGQWKRLFSLNEEMIEKLVYTARQRARRPVADLNLYFTLHVPVKTDVDSLLAKLNKLEVIQHATRMPAFALPVPPDMSQPVDVDGDGSNDRFQQYLTDRDNGGGVDAYYAWKHKGGAGAGVGICDMEVNFNATHQDFEGSVTILGEPPLVAALETITYPSWADPSSFLADGTSHGTNVAGIYGSRENGFGTTGIAHDADLFFASSVTAEYGFNMPNAILNATVGLDAGDIICLEHHIPGPNSPIALDLLQTEEAFVPVEWDIATYDTILLATTLGRIVVEAAGNGSQNLDGAEFTANFGVFTHAPFAPGNRSGAIIVGAGRSPLDGADSARTRHGFSNFGSRVDVHGWGDRCVTTGPLAGNTPGYWGTEGADLFYINNFNGTSSATPVVVGVAACVQGVFKENYGRPLTPFEMGNLLFRTGREQVRRSDNPEPNPIQNIGPLVDLHGAVNSILGKCEPPVIVGAGSQAAGQQTDVSFVFGLGTSRFNSAIRFTLDGSTPTQNSPVWNPDTTITITESTTVKARTFTTEFHPITGERNVSETAIRGFTFEEAGAGETVFDPPAGTYEHTIEVDIDIELPEEGGLSDAIILYNIDQDADPSFEPGNPTNSFFYFGEFTLTIGNGQSTEVRTVKARLYGVNDNGQAAYGPVYTATYTLTP